MTARLRETYKSDVFTALKDKFNYANVNEVPKLEKITINDYGICNPGASPNQWTETCRYKG